MPTSSPSPNGPSSARRGQDIDIATGCPSLRHIEPIAGWTPTPMSKSAASPRHRTAPRCPSSSCADAMSTSTAGRPLYMYGSRGTRSASTGLRLRLVALAAVAARPRGGVRVRSSSRRRRDGEALVAARPTAGETEHFDDQAAVADFLGDGLSMALASCARAVGRWSLQGVLYCGVQNASPGSWRRGRSSASSPTMSDLSLPLTVTEWDSGEIRPTPATAM